MLKFAANITFLFRDMPLVDRIYAAADAGFDGVEILFPYDEDVKLIRRALTSTGLPLVLINAPPPNYSGGVRGFAAVPTAAGRFQYDLRRALRYARELGAGRLHIMAGEAEGAEAEQTYLDNLRWAAGEVDGLPLTIEPINPHDMPGYFLNDFDQAARILATVDAPNLTLQFDAYHAHRVTGDSLATWAKHGHLATHIQIAGAPGRHEPITGDIDYGSFFDALRASGYSGFISAEYHPADGTEQGLGWLAEARA